MLDAHGNYRPPPALWFPWAMPAIRVLVSDPQVLVADALAGVLERYDDLEVVSARPESGTAAVQAAVAYEPEVILTEFWVRDMSGPAAVELLLGKLPTANILVLSWFHGPDQIQQALEAGAVGFLPKSLRVPQVHEAILRADAGENPVFAEELSELVDLLQRRGQYVSDMGERLRSLSGRELEVLQLLAAGLPNDDIAKRLHLAPGTVRTHIHQILSKTGARSQVEAVAIARDHELVP